MPTLLRMSSPEPIETPSLNNDPLAVQHSKELALQLIIEEAFGMDAKENTRQAITAPKNVSDVKCSATNGPYRDESSYSTSSCSVTSETIDRSNYGTSLPGTNEPATKKIKYARNNKTERSCSETSFADDIEWMDFFDQLVSYKAKHGTPIVPMSDKTYPKLANWIQRQIKKYARGILTKEHRDLLNSIGVNLHENRKRSNATWEAMLQRYQAYKKTHNLMVVTRMNAEDPALANWVTYQRRLYKTGKLQKDRSRRLDDLGFD